MSETSARLFAKLVHETKQLFWIAIYFWIVIGMFTVYKALVSNDENLIYHQGFAIINAFVLAKVVLVAELFRTAENLRDEPLIYPIVFKSAVFCVLLIAFHYAEEIAVGAWHGKSFADSLPEIGGGGIRGTLVIVMILFVALIPFFFYRELCRVLGGDNVYALLFRARRRAGQ